MKMNRDYLKKIISEEVKSILKEEEKVIEIPSYSFSEKEKRMIKYAKTVKGILGDNADAASLSSEAVLNALNIDSFKDLTYEEKMQGLKMLYGSLAKWPEIVRTVAMGMNPNLDTQTAAPAGKPQQVVTLTGKGGAKCQHAVTVQTQALKTIVTLAREFGLNETQLTALKSRLSDGILGNTTLSIMKFLSGGQMIDQDYPLNDKKSYIKACNIKKEVLDTILSNMNVKPKESAQIIMKAVGIQAQTAESKNIEFEKALKAAILRELKKSS